MAEVNQPQRGMPVVTVDGRDFPSSSFPVLFTDGVSSMARGPGVMKFYLFRYDPSVRASGNVEATAFAQIVMSKEAFVQTAAFFESQVRVLLSEGDVSQEWVDKCRDAFSGVGINAR